VEFRWNAWNIDHVGRHGVEPAEAEEIVEEAEAPFPRKIREDKRFVWGSTSGGRMLQVVFILDDDGTVFVIHARDLTDREKRQYRRSRT